MMQLPPQVQAVGLFYRGVAPFMLGISGVFLLAVMVPALLEGFTHDLIFRLLLAKLATAPAVWFLAEKLRPGQYWFYFNLNLSWRQLWAAVVMLDAALFLAAAGAVQAVLA